MANPPPVRPWFRLASLRSAPVPAPAPAPEARPTLTLPPSFRTASAPPSPQTQPQERAPEPTAAPPRIASADRASAPSSPAQKVPAASASLPTSPVQKVAVTDSSSVPSSPSRKPPSTFSPDKAATTTARVASPTQSPKTIKQAVQSPVHSPKLTPTAPPPSPLTLPPSQLKTNSGTEPKIPVEAEPKTVLVQETIEKPKQWLGGNGELHRETGEIRSHGNAHHGKHVTGKEGEAKEKGIQRKLSDSEDSAMRVITIAGENRGAYMELIQSPKKQEPNYLHKKGNSTVKADGGESESSSSEEGNTKRKDKNHKGRITSSFPMAAYMNSNVQSVNNSLLYHTSCSHHDPGVRLSLSKKPFGEGYHFKEHVDGQST